MVFFLNAVVPKHVVKLPSLYTAEELSKALKAYEESKPYLPANTPMVDALNMCHDVKRASKLQPLLEDCLNKFRGELYRDISSPLHRLKLHEAVMATGFLDSSVRVTPPGDNRRFMVNHYNFDVRRDTRLMKSVHAILLEQSKPSSDDEAAITDLLLIERRLFGRYRFAAVGGRQWLCAGAPLQDIHDEEELTRVFAIPHFKEYGNFGTSVVVDDGGNKRTANRWKKTTILCLPEPSNDMVALESDYAKINQSDLTYSVSTILPPPPQSASERRREKMLNAFVLIFAAWLSFWFVDEEIITLVTMMVLKWKQMRILDQEREERGERKLYIAQGTDNGVRYAGTPKQY